MEKRRGLAFSQVKDDLKLLKRAYDLRFQRGVTWTSIDRELGLKPAEGMTALNCVERFIDTTKDPKIRAKGIEWRRQRRVKLQKRKSANLPVNESSPAPLPIEEQRRNLQRARDIAAKEKMRVDNLKQGLRQWLAAMDNATRELKRCCNDG